MMAAITRARTTQEWVELLGPVGVPCGPINDIEQAFADPQVAARGLKIVQPTAAGQRWCPRSPAWLHRCAFRRHPPVLRNAPPALGQHTEEVLATFGIDADQLAAMRRDGIV